MSDEQLIAFKEELIRQREELIETILGEIEDEQTPFNISGDLADKAEVLTYVSVSEELTASQRNTLDKIDRALKRIDDGLFGKCSVCSNYIELERLEALPYVETCKTHMQ
ncbi:MAG: TraR/DksA family transcriptional regulator [Brevinema sp.]